jgi:hypothetical protein
MRICTGRVISVTTALAFASGAQLIAQVAPSTNPSVRRVLDRIKADNAWTLDQQQSICEIPAPPFKETTRGAEYKRRLEALGLTVRIDSIGNVIAERRGTGGGKTVLIEGHLDTVFPEGTNVKVKREGTKMTAPGIGDDCRGLAVVLSVARAFQMEKLATAGTVIFVGNVGEEGPGNLRGTRHLLTREYKGKIDYFISVDGTGLGVTSRAVGSNRYRVTYQGLWRVRHAESDPRVRPGHCGDCRHPGAHVAQGDVQRRHHRRRHFRQHDLAQRRDGRRLAFRVGEGARGPRYEVPGRGTQRTRSREREVAGVEGANLCQGGHNRYSTRRRAAGQRIHRSHRRECRKGARLHGTDVRIEHRCELPDEPGDPRHHDRWWR